MKEVIFLLFNIRIVSSNIQLRDDETLEITYDQFEKAILPILAQESWPKASEELLLQAFRVIEDTLNKMQADADAEAEFEAEQANREEDGEDEKTPEQLAAEKEQALMLKKQMRSPPELSGHIDADKLQELLSQHGEPLKPTELEDFVNV